MKNISIEELKLQIDTAEWSSLRIHCVRGALIVVSENLDIACAGHAIAADDAAAVTSWIGSGALYKPTAEQLAAWDNTPSRCFSFLIIQPYVLVREPESDTAGAA